MPAVLDLDAQCVLHTYARAPFVLTHGEGVYLYDSEGHCYLDLAAGIAVNALGYGDPALVAAISQQAAQLIHVSNLYLTAPQAELAARLCALSFAGKVFFCNSGAEANEAAIKLARKWIYARHPATGKTGLVAFENGFHGRTIGALSVTPRARYQDPFRPLLPDVTIAPFNDLEAAAGIIGPDTCAVIVEPVQGEGGVHVATPEFLQGLRALCDAHDAILIFDEVQCGMGRTGMLWAHQASGVTPDIMTLAKPLAGGLPIGAALISDRIAAVIEVGDHGSTFGGGPLVASAARVVLERISDPAFLRHVEAMGAALRDGLAALHAPQIVEVRGRGLMIGVELTVPAAEVVSAGYAHGLIMVSAGPNVLRLVPPLILEQAHVDEALEKLDAILRG
ncbi:MAG: aspartate aminotransferase family protein [Anaerolineae bacterium]|nr:aspartate aminotransferase family protein [Anaerolineae bacterium]